MPSNLPPGVTESMIPGNRPEDLEEEKFWEKVTEKLNQLEVNENISTGNISFSDEQFTEFVDWLKDFVWKQGFDEGRAEEQIEQLEQSLKEEE